MTPNRRAGARKEGIPRSFPYVTITLAALAFSLLAAALLTRLLPRQPVIPAERSIFSPNLARHYRLLRELLTLPVPGSPLAPEEVEIRAPQLRPLLTVRASAALLEAGEYARALETLGPPPAADHFTFDRDRSIRLRCLYRLDRLAEFQALYEHAPSAEAELPILYINSLVRGRRQSEARAAFQKQFRRGRLAPFQDQMDKRSLQLFLSELGADFWREKFAWLLARRDGAEFRSEARLTGRFPQLTAIYGAEFAYMNREWSLTQQLLNQVSGSPFQLDKEKLLFKMKLRQEGEEALAGGLDRFQADPELHRQVLLDAASLLLAKGFYARSLPLLARYRMKTPMSDEGYWRSLWTTAWVHMRNRDVERALPFFQVGIRSPFLAYRLACHFWLSRLEGISCSMVASYPFSYYAVRMMTDQQSYRDLNRRFCRLFNDPPGRAVQRTWGLLRLLLTVGWVEEARDAVRYALARPDLSGADRNLLHLADSIIFLKSGQFRNAFVRLRENFPTIEELRLPDFLSAIILPVFYRSEIERYSQINRLDPWLVMALIREESFFHPAARSSANAYGLMQLLPSTAFDLVREEDPVSPRPDLLDPEVNIRLGTRHLRGLLARYQGRLPLALAAYNAGEFRVDSWRNEFSGSDDDEFIEMIPFTETRNYVKNILRNYFFYRYYHAKNEDRPAVRR